MTVGRDITIKPACHRVTMVVLSLCLCAAAPPTLSQHREPVDRLRQAAGEPFKNRETDHFTIAYNTDYNVLRPLIGRLEGTFNAVWRFAAENNLADRHPEQKLDVIVFDQFEEFTRYAERVGVRAGGMAGFYHPRTNVAAFCNMYNSPALASLGSEIDRIQQQHAALTAANRTATLGQRKRLRRALSNLIGSRESLVKRFNRLVIQHEGAHQVFFNLGVHVREAQNPDWLVEGLACQFEVPQSNRTGKIQSVNHMRLGDFREAFALAPNVQEVSPQIHATALSTGRVIPLTELIAGAGFADNDAGHAAYRYAQSWALVYYLSRRQSRAFGLYLKQLTARTPGEAVGPEREVAEFESRFGKVDPAFEKDWLTHTLRLRFDPDEAKR